MAASTTTRRIGFMVGASVLVVALVAMLLRGGGDGGGDDAGAGRASARDGGVDVAGAPAKRAEVGLGVQSADVDSAARRRGAQVPRGLEAGMGPPVERGPGIAVEQPPPGPPTVSPPVVPSAAAIAESAEIEAAQPAAKAEVDAWLASQRAGIRTNCWNGDDLPAAASFVVEVSYSAEGSMLARSLSDSGAPPAVGGCVNGWPTLVPPTIDPPGIAVSVRGALTLP